MTSQNPDVSGWLTNDAIVARKLRTIDRRYERAKRGMIGLGVVAKAEAMRIARNRRQDAYDAITKEAGL